MPFPLNNYQTQDQYDNIKGTIKLPNTVRIDLFVYNASIYFQLADNGGGFLAAETFMAPGERSFSWHAGGIRVRSAVAGVPAQVTVVLLTTLDISDA